MMDQYSRTCNSCGCKVTYCVIDDAHGPPGVTQFVAIMLQGKLAGCPAVTDNCPRCGKELTLESTSEIPAAR